MVTIFKRFQDQMVQKSETGETGTLQEEEIKK
jgi:hypothetical protein